MAARLASPETNKHGDCRQQQQQQPGGRGRGGGGWRGGSVAPSQAETIRRRGVWVASCPSCPSCPSSPVLVASSSGPACPHQGGGGGAGGRGGREGARRHASPHVSPRLSHERDGVPLPSWAPARRSDGPQTPPAPPGEEGPITIYWHSHPQSWQTILIRVCILFLEGNTWKIIRLSKLYNLLSYFTFFILLYLLHSGLFR